MPSRKILLELQSYATQFDLVGPYNPETETEFSGFNIRRLKISQLKFRIPEANHNTLSIYITGLPAPINLNKSQYYTGYNPPTLEDYFKNFMIPDVDNSFVNYVNDDKTSWDFEDITQLNVIKQLEIYIKVDNQNTNMITATNKLFLELEFTDE